MRISDWSSDVCSSDLNTDFGDSQFRFSTTDEAQTLRADQRPRDQIAQHRATPQSSEQYNESQGDAQQYDAFSQQNITRAGCLYPLVLHLPSYPLAIAAPSALAPHQHRTDG